jgi:hypothetical protein
VDSDRQFDNEEEGENTFVYPTSKAANHGMRLMTVVVSEGTDEVGSNMSNRSSNSLLCPFLSPSSEELGYEKPDNTLMIFSVRQMTSIQVDRKYGPNMSLSRLIFPSIGLKSRSECLSTVDVRSTDGKSYFRY